VENNTIHFKLSEKNLIMYFSISLTYAVLSFYIQVLLDRSQTFESIKS